MEDKRLNFFEWFIRVKYAMVAIGSFKRSSYGVVYLKLDENSFLPLYLAGLTPIEAAIESELNNN